MKNKVIKELLFLAALGLLGNISACVTSYGAAGTVAFCTEDQETDDEQSFYSFVTDEQYDAWMDLLDANSVDEEYKHEQK